jgi:hypothetical protein
MRYLAEHLDGEPHLTGRGDQRPGGAAACCGVPSDERGVA